MLINKMKMKVTGVSILIKLPGTEYKNLSKDLQFLQIRVRMQTVQTIVKIRLNS